MTREKILLYGGPGVGKSRAWASIAKRYPHTHVWVIDTDDAADRVLQEFGELSNVTVLPCLEWEDWKAALDQVQANHSEGDWLAVDFISTAWEAVQNYFVRKVFDQEPEEYFLQVRRALKASAKTMEALSGWTDWLTIKKLYAGLMAVIKYRLTDMHLLGTAQVKTFMGDESKELQSLFQGFRGYPAGEKNLPYEFHTVILLERDREHGFVMSSAKDRSRELLNRAPVKDFALQYVKKIAKVGSNQVGSE